MTVTKLEVSDELFAEMKEYLSYSPETGNFTWIKARGKRGTVGAIAGSVHHNGYLIVKFNKKKFAAHRLAWLFTHGAMPTNFIDHRDGDGFNNKIDNLREATNGQNVQNLRNATRVNKLGILGVHWATKAKKYKAQIKFNGKVMYIGAYDCPQEAHQAYLTKKRELHEFCTI